MDIHSKSLSMRGSSLPVDCWRRVFDFLSFDDFLSISRVSRDLNAFVKPLIYRTVSLNWMPTPWVRVLQLLRTIIRQPDCASYVRHAIFVPGDPEHPLKLKPSRDISDLNNALHQAEEFVREAEFPDTSTWARAIHAGDPYACVAVFLSQLHSLQTLRLDSSFVRRSGFPGLMLRHALFSAPRGMLSTFSLLTAVDYGSNLSTASAAQGNSEANSGGHLPCNEDQFTAWFYLPSLCCLGIWLPTRQDVLVPERENNLGQLQTLAIARATIGEERASRLFLAATAVQKLHLGMSYKLGEEVALENGPAILRGLNAVSSSVTDLSIGLEYCPWDGLKDKEKNLISPFHGFLSQFSKLKSAEIPAPLLLGWDWQPTHPIDATKILPPTLQSLCLRMDYGGRRSSNLYELVILDFVEYNVHKLKLHAPDLKRICLRLFESSRWDKGQRDVQRLCARERIRFNVVFDNVSIGLWTFDGYPFVK